MWRGLVVMLLLAWALGPSCAEENASKFCVYNSDCEGSERPYCVAGICRVEQCITGHDCRLDEHCVEGVCQPGGAGGSPDAVAADQ